jgi:hypothetical protein
MAAVLVTALYARIHYPGFSSSVAVLYSIMILSFSHPRCRWTNYQKTFVQEHFGMVARLQRRALRHAKHILLLVSLMIGAGLIVALAVGTTKSVKIPKWPPKIPPIGIPDGYEARKAASRVFSEPSIFKPAICSLKPSETSHLNVLDIAAMARGSYENSTERAQAQMLAYHRPNLKNWRTYNGTLKTAGSGVRWVEYRLKNTTNETEDVSDLNLSVVAVRGTSNFNDVFQDLYLWSTSALLQMSSFFGTMVSLWPAETVDSFAQFIMTFGPIDSTLVYWNKVEEHVDHLLSEGRTVIMTGHSLGGAVAAVVAVHKSIPSASFSAPGLGFSTRRCKLFL